MPFTDSELSTGDDALGQPSSPFDVGLSVIVRTQGTRLLSLEDALLCLAAQSSSDFEVVVVLHSDRSAAVPEVAELVAGFDSWFQSRVRFAHAPSDGGRAVPLNVGLDHARGRYVAFLDDDDVVTSDWVTTFIDAAERFPQTVIRANALLSRVRLRRKGELSAPFFRVSGPVAAYARTFDFIEHLYDNQTPICSFAIPRSRIDDLGIRFRDDLPVLEDWHLLLRAASACGVIDTGVFTSIYQQWIGDEGSKAINEKVWQHARESVLMDLDEIALTLPRGSASRLNEIQRGIARGDRAVGERLTQADLIINSTIWRATAPVRWLLDRLKAGIRRLRRRRRDSR